jgi:hypothetical protein
MKGWFQTSNLVLNIFFGMCLISKIVLRSCVFWQILACVWFQTWSCFYVLGWLICEMFWVSSCCVCFGFGFRGEFKDLVISHATKAEPLSYADLYSHLLNYPWVSSQDLPSIHGCQPISVAHVVFPTFDQSCLVSVQPQLQS